VNVSGILVVVPVDEVGLTVKRLGQLEGVEVHHTDRPTGRIVVTIEAPTVEGEVDILQKVKSLPDVILAEMVQHHIDVDSDPEIAGTPRPSGAREVPDN